MSIKRWETSEDNDSANIKQQLQQELGYLVSRGGSGTVMYSALWSNQQLQGFQSHLSTRQLHYCTPLTINISTQRYFWVIWLLIKLQQLPCETVSVLNCFSFREHSSLFLIKILRLTETCLSIGASAALMTDFLLHLIEPLSA